MRAIEQRSAGRYLPSPGTVYPALQMLEEMGMIASRQQAGRKVYEATARGRAELERSREEIEDIYERFGGGPPGAGELDLPTLEDHVGRIVRAVGRALRAGRLRPEKLNEVLDVIDEAASRIERILRRDRGG